MWSDDLKTILESANVAVRNVSLFVSSSAVLPAVLPDTGILTIRETGGSGPDETHNSLATPAYQMPGAQIIARAKTYAAAMALARAAYLAFRIRNQTINGTKYRSIKALQEPFDGGPDPNRNAQVIFNIVGDKVYS